MKACQTVGLAETEVAREVAAGGGGGGGEKKKEKEKEGEEKVGKEICKSIHGAFRGVGKDGRVGCERGIMWTFIEVSKERNDIVPRRICV